jgi:hypothetical protein
MQHGRSVNFASPPLDSEHRRKRKNYKNSKNGSPTEDRLPPAFKITGDQFFESIRNTWFGFMEITENPIKNIFVRHDNTNVLYELDKLMEYLSRKMNNHLQEAAVVMDETDVTKEQHNSLSTPFEDLSVRERLTPTNLWSILKAIQKNVYEINIHKLDEEQRFKLFEFEERVNVWVECVKREIHFVNKPYAANCKFVDEDDIVLSFDEHDDTTPYSGNHRDIESFFI